MAETETVIQFPEPKPRLHCLTCHAEGPAPCGCGAKVVPVAEARELRKTDAHARYAKGETMSQIAEDWHVSEKQISRDLEDFNSDKMSESKRPKSATNPKGAGRRKGTAAKRKPRRKPDERQHQASVNSTPTNWEAFKEKAAAKGVSAAALLGAIVAGPDIDPATLSLTAKDKLASAERQMRRKLEAEHAARLAALDEEVREKVLTRNREYLAKLNAMEEEAALTQDTYRKFMERQAKIFTKDEYRLVVMCVHADGSISAEKRNDATRLLLAKRFALTGERQ